VGQIRERQSMAKTEDKKRCDTCDCYDCDCEECTCDCHKEDETEQQEEVLGVPV
jgi:hypothetical protein